MSFAELVDEIYTLDYENKRELKTLIEKYMIEDRRKEIRNNYIEAIELADNNELYFTAETDDLMSMLR